MPYPEALSRRSTSSWRTFDRGEDHVVRPLLRRHGTRRTRLVGVAGQRIAGWREPPFADLAVTIERLEVPPRQAPGTP